MNLPALFSLIAASLIGLLPIFLLIGRRIRQSRPVVRRGAGEGSLASDADLASDDEEATPPAGRDPGRQSGGILDRIAHDRRRGRTDSPQKTSRAPVFPRGDVYPPAGAAARSGSAATVEASAIGGNPIAASNAGGALVPGTNRPSGAMLLELRLNRLSPLQRAVVFREVLGPPAALSDRAREW